MFSCLMLHTPRTLRFLRSLTYGHDFAGSVSTFTKKEELEAIKMRSIYRRVLTTEAQV